MITLFLVYKETQLARIVCIAVPAIGDQVSYEDVLYRVTARAFMYESGFTSVICSVEKERGQ